MKNNLPRHKAGSLELKEGTGRITYMFSCGDYLEIYKIDATFRVHSPESLDPEEINPTMPWVAKHVANVGTGNRIIARLLIQSKQLLEAVSLPKEIKKDELYKLLQECKELLLSCENIASEVEEESRLIIDNIENNRIPKDNKARTYYPFPQVSDLINQASNFLVNAKRYLQVLVELFNLFFQTEFHGPHFHKILKWIEEELGKESQLYQLITENEATLKYIINLRNFQEHPTKDKRTNIDNFILLPSMKIQPPQWYVTGDQPTSIFEDMNFIVKYFIQLTEVLLISSIFEKIQSNLPFYIEEIPREKRDPECPIKYRMQIDISKLTPSKGE
jgi:hypothetical protein